MAATNAFTAIATLVGKRQGKSSTVWMVLWGNTKETDRFEDLSEMK
jgi:hypothetical protein